MSARPEDVIAEALCMFGANDKHGRSIEAAAIATALRTAGFVIEQDWQTMETAPRDGRPCFVGHLIILACLRVKPNQKLLLVFFWKTIGGVNPR